jgi:hypothetical protein
MPGWTIRRVPNPRDLRAPRAATGLHGARAPARDAPALAMGSDGSRGSRGAL